MRHLACVFCTALFCMPAFAGDEQDRYEEQLTMQHANQRVERGMRGEFGERGQWVRELESVYPGKLQVKEGADEAAAWFDLLAGTNDAWRKTDAAAAGLGQMYERVVQRLQLGPVPSIKREEFLRYAKPFLRNNNQPMAEGNLNENADKVFRVLDANGDGELTGDEMSSGLRADKLQADTNGNGRISKEEYREYFKRRVEQKSETLLKAYKANAALWRGMEGVKRVGGLPEWFTSLDTDKDKQISLFEWREGGKPLAIFKQMDLNGDGLITREEYLRFVKLKDMEELEKKRDEGK